VGTDLIGFAFRVSGFEFPADARLETPKLKTA
jgi:hypothetical protein